MSKSSDWSKSEEQEVVSEVNNFLVPATIKPIQKSTNRIAKLGFSFTRSRNPESETRPNIVDERTDADKVRDSTLEVDTDGDLVLRRLTKTPSSDLKESSILIEYENSTTLGMVGLQVWRGAFLVSDFILHFSEKYFKEKTVLDLGSGTGLAGIIASIYATKVIATDMNETTILDLIKANVAHNRGIVKGEFLVKALDFMDLNWTEEMEDLVKSTDVVLAADVIYHVGITDAFIQTLSKIVRTGTKPKDLFIAMEKRYVFTMSDLDTMSPMYSHFMDEMDSKLNLSPGCLPRPLEGTKLKISMKIIPTDFDQYFNYEKTKELILLHIQTEHV